MSGKTARFPVWAHDIETERKISLPEGFLYETESSVVTENGHVLVLGTSPLPSGATQIADHCTKYGPYSRTVGRLLPTSPIPCSIEF